MSAASANKEGKMYANTLSRYETSVDGHACQLPSHISRGRRRHGSRAQCGYFIHYIILRRTCSPATWRHSQESWATISSLINQTTDNDGGNCYEPIASVEPLLDAARDKCQFVVVKKYLYRLLKTLHKTIQLYLNYIQKQFVDIGTTG